MKTTKLNQTEINKLKPLLNEISHYNVVSKGMITPISVYFNGKNYFATTGKLFNVRQNHKVIVKGEFDKISNYLLSIAN